MIKIKFVNPDKETPKKKIKIGEDESENKKKTAPLVEEVLSSRNKKKSEENDSDDGDYSKNDPQEAGDAGLKLNWLAQLRWSRNPFADFQATPAREFIVGHAEARKACNLFILRRGKFGIITGGAGYGKTMFLNWLGEELSAHKNDFRVLKIKGTTPAQTLTEELVKPYKGFFSSYKGTSPEDLATYLSKKEQKQLVILVDDADSLGETEVELKALLAAGKTIVVLAGEHPPKLQEPNVSIAIGELTPQEAIEVVKKRIMAVGGSGFQPFTSDELHDQWKASNYHLQTFLMACEHEAMEYAVRPSKSETESLLRETADENPVADSSSPKPVSEFDELISSLSDDEEKESHSKKHKKK